MHFMTLGYCTIAVALLNNNKYLYELSIFSSFFCCARKKSINLINAHNSMCSSFLLYLILSISLVPVYHKTEDRKKVIYDLKWTVFPSVSMSEEKQGWKDAQ